MSVVRPVTPPLNEVVSDEILHFDYPGSDIILRSCDSHDFRVPQLYLVNSSPVIRDLIQGVPSTSDIANQESLPVVELPESGAILHNLLTFIFPVTPVLPSTTELVMKLLAVAQKYRMDSVLTHIRAHSRQDPPFILPETALHVYFLAQKYELRQEMVLAARSTLRLSMSLEDLVGKIDFMPGTYLRELWVYHERVRTGLVSSLLEFRKSAVMDMMKDTGCVAYTSDFVPQWLDDYIGSLAQSLPLFDLVEFENTRASHIKDEARRTTTLACADISSRIVRAFWEALTAVVHGTIEKADSALALVKEDAAPETSDRPFEPLSLKVPDANVIVRSSDQVNFRVHKSLLAMSSPLFDDLFSLPQPPDGEIVDGLPVVQLSEDAYLLNSLVSLIYPVPPVIPGSYEKVFALLAACQKYDMVSIQSYIRDEIKRGRFPMPVGTEAFRAYAIASNLGLIPEMEGAGRLTLSHPMTLESLGEGLRAFNGRVLRDLAPDVEKQKLSGEVLIEYPSKCSHQPALAEPLLYEQEH
ncbi:hypothetical protein EDB89DRAFT_2235687 [Lactarius sanguifluus]|nr:hypothetical protein EDB89DRAFT_2235687 [Lactarius sanguifluus]